MFIRADSNVVVETSTNFSIYNPIIAKDIVAVSSDTLHFKVGNGVDFWSDLPYNGGSQIGGYAVTTDIPTDWDVIYFDVDDSTWKYTPRGIADTVTNLIANGTTVYPTFCPIVELSDSTGRPTGKIKITDGATQFASIPWTMGGIVVYGAFATGITGKSIEYNGVEWIPIEYWDKTEFPSPTPTGTKYLRDDMTWATVGIITPSSSVDGNIVIFNGTTGSNIRDSGVSTSSLVTASGCPNNTFQIGTSYNGVKIKHNSGELQVRNAADTAFADAEFATIYCDFATVRNNLYIKGTHDLTANAFGTVTLDGSIIWTQSTDGSGSGLDADLLDGHESAYFASIGYLTSDFASINHSHFASEIVMATLGTPTYTTVQDWVNEIQSSGRISGGVITSGTAGTINTSSLKGFIKISDNEVATTKLFDMAASTGISLTDNNINYVYVEYNSGTPRIQVTTNRSTIRQTDQFTLGRVFRSGTTVKIMNSGINLYNRTRKIHEKWIDTFGGLSYANGLIYSFTGLSPGFTAGTLYAGSNKISISAKDYSSSGTFTYYYTTDNGSTWTTFATNVINNTQYNNASSGLSSLSNNQYGVHWIYIDSDGDTSVLFGKASYTLAEAQNIAEPVTPIPNYLSQWAKLAAKVIILKSASYIYSITHAWETAFPIQDPGDHNSLATLQGGTTDEYYHLTASEYASTQTMITTTYVKWLGYTSSDPTGSEGAQYWNTSTSKLKVYSNGAWHNSDGTT